MWIMIHSNDVHRSECKNSHQSTSTDILSMESRGHNLFLLSNGHLLFILSREKKISFSSFCPFFSGLLWHWWAAYIETREAINQNYLSFCWCLHWWSSHHHHRHRQRVYDFLSEFSLCPLNAGCLVTNEKLAIFLFI